MERCSAEPASVLKCQTECLGSLALVGRAADSSIQMTVATSVENVATTPMTATATTREAADAAGLGPGPVVAATLAAAAMSGDTVPHPTPGEGAGHHPRAGPDPDRRSGGIVHPHADPEALLGGPEHPSAGAVVPAPVPAPAPDRVRAARPGPAPVPDPPAAKETAVLGLPAREPAPHQMLTDEGSAFPISTSSSVSLPLTSEAVFQLVFSLSSGTVKSLPLASCSSPALVSLRFSFYFNDQRFPAFQLQM